MRLMFRDILTLMLWIAFIILASPLAPYGSYFTVCIFSAGALILSHYISDWFINPKYGNRKDDL